MTDEGQKQRVWIESERVKTKAIPVMLHKLPRWASDALRRAYKGSGLPRYFSPATAILNDARWRGLFDHWGTSTLADGRRVLVTEPYPSGDVLPDASAFATWLGCDVRVVGPSWWYPGYTLRIEFTPRVSP